MGKYHSTQSFFDICEDCVVDLSLEWKWKSLEWIFVVRTKASSEWIFISETETSE